MGASVRIQASQHVFSHLHMWRASGADELGCSHQLVLSAGGTEPHISLVLAWCTATVTGTQPCLTMKLC